MRLHPVVVLYLAVPLLGATELETFHSAEWGITVRYPADLSASDTFSTNYFDRGAWRISYAAGTGPGTRVLALALPPLATNDAGGNSRATAELRIGASRDPDVVASCLTYGMNSGNNAETRQREIGGVTFTEVPDNSDAGMSQNIASDDFRAVHNGACVAIDLVLYSGGTSNRPPAYTPDQLASLQQVLGAISFD